MGYGIKIGGTVQLKKVAKPTVSVTAFTFDNQEKALTISGYDSNAMTMTGSTKATSSGSYSVTFTLNKGYKWSDGSKTPHRIAWQINKRAIDVPTVSGDYAFDGNTPRKANISGNDETYITTGGTTSSASYSDSAYTVSFMLNYPNDTYWNISGSPTSVQYGYWYVRWVNGQSHYSNDIYNRGWGIENLYVDTSSSAGGQINSDSIQINGHSYSGYVIQIRGSFNSGDTLNVDIERFGSRGQIQIAECYSGGSSFVRDVYETVDAGTRKTLSTTFKRTYISASGSVANTFCWADAGQRIYRIWR